jgi:mycothiol maleylpyruvate isomerase-like protein
MSPDEQSSLVDLLRAERAGWEELEGLVEALSPEQAEVSGYLPGWSVKDFLAHLAGWLAEAGQALERIRSGTFTDSDVDVDARNEAFVDANRDQPLSVVVFEVKTARRRLLHHLHGLAEVPPPAEDSLSKAGPQHYAQHLPRLREWVAELRSEHSLSE